MFLADNRRIAWIKSRKSLLPYKGLQEYENHREKVLNNKEVRTFSLFDSFRFCRAKQFNSIFSSSNAADENRSQERQNVFQTQS